jgi:hypothetical protein
MENNIPRRAARRHLNSHFIKTKHGQVRTILFWNLLIAEADETLLAGNAGNPADHTPFAPQGGNHIGTGTRGLESPLDSRRLLELSQLKETRS